MYYNTVMKKIFSLLITFLFCFNSVALSAELLQGHIEQTDEYRQNVGKQFTVTFGKPIPWQTFTDKSKSYAQWAAWVEDLVYTL